MFGENKLIEQIKKATLKIKKKIKYMWYMDMAR